MTSRKVIATITFCWENMDLGWSSFSNFVLSEIWSESQPWEMYSWNHGFRIETYSCNLRHLIWRVHALVAALTRFMNGFWTELIGWFKKGPMHKKYVLRKTIFKFPKCNNLCSYRTEEKQVFCILFVYFSPTNLAFLFWLTIWGLRYICLTDMKFQALSWDNMLRCKLNGPGNCDMTNSEVGSFSRGPGV